MSGNDFVFCSVIGSFSKNKHASLIHRRSSSKNLQLVTD